MRKSGVTKKAIFLKLAMRSKTAVATNRKLCNTAIVTAVARLKKGEIHITKNNLQKEKPN